MVDEGGVTALGVPIGSDAFVREAMQQKSQGAQDKVNCVMGEASLSVLDHAKACAEAISKEAMSEGDVDAVTKDTGYGRVLGEIIRDWGVACAKRRAECLIKLVSKTVPNLSTASGGGRLATDYNKFTRRCRMVAQSARRSAASYFGRTGLPGQAGGAQAGQPVIDESGDAARRPRRTSGRNPPG